MSPWPNRLVLIAAAMMLSTLASAAEAQLSGPECDDAVEALAARQGKFTRYDVLRELGPECEERVRTIFEQGMEVIRICRERVDAALRYGARTMGQVRAAVGVGCQDFVDRLEERLGVSDHTRIGR